MLLRKTTRLSGEKYNLRKLWLIIISLAYISVHVQAQNGWTQKSPIPTPRAAACACVVENKIYVIGGYSPSFGNFAVNEVYDPSTDEWQTKSPLPQARGYLSCAVVNGIIYAIGGGYPTATKTVYAYDPVTNTWTQKADMPSIRRSAQAGVVNGIIYNIGGNHGVSQPSLACDAYDPVTNTWSAKANIPTGGGNLAAIVYNDSIYTFGGSNNSTWAPFSYVYAYNPQTNTWSPPKQSMPTSRFGLIALLTNDHIYAIGGGSSQSSALGTVEEYNPVTDTWEPGDNMPIISVFLSGAVVNGKIYVISGTSDWSTGVLNVWEYDPTIPVELTSFIASANGKEVTLKWSTATELNNQGFEVQRKFGSNDFVTVGSVKGNGTTTTPNNYTYVDKLFDAGKYFYRLKQIDYGGKYEYSQEVEVNWSPFTTYKLEQNYPNPFNPTTKISWQSPVSGWQTLRVYDVLGNEVATLVDEYREAGHYEVEFKASSLASGIYFYQLKVGEFISTKKMILIR